MYETKHLGLLLRWFHKVVHRDKDGSCGDLCQDLCGQHQKCGQVTDDGGKCTCSTECDGLRWCSSDENCAGIGVCQDNLCCETSECAETEETLQKLISLQTEMEKDRFGGEQDWLYAKVYGSELDAPVATAAGGHLRNYIGQTYPPMEVTVTASQYVEHLKVTLKTIEDLASKTGMDKAMDLYEQKSAELSEAYEELVGVPYPGTLMDYLTAYNDNDLNWVPYVAVVKKGSEQHSDAPTYEGFLEDHGLSGNRNSGGGSFNRKLDSAEVCACPKPVEECQFDFSFAESEGCEEWSASPPVVPSTCFQGKGRYISVVWDNYAVFYEPTELEMIKFVKLTGDFFKSLLLTKEFDWPIEYVVEDFVMEFEDSFDYVDSPELHIYFTVSAKMPNSSPRVDSFFQPQTEFFLPLDDAIDRVKEDYWNFQYNSFLESAMPNTPFAYGVHFCGQGALRNPGDDLIADCAAPPFVPSSTCLRLVEEFFGCLWSNGASFSEPKEQEISYYVALTSDFFKGLFLADNNWPSEYELDNFRMELDRYFFPLLLRDLSTVSTLWYLSRYPIPRS